MFNIEKFVDGLHDYIARALTPLSVRLKALEDREPAAGAAGEKGEPGADGKDGRDGIDGKDGKDGIDGKDGEPGEKGDPGEPGAQGDPGEKGDPGEPGAQGEPGERGEKGEPGADGKDGRDGIDGKNIELDDVEAMLQRRIDAWALDFERRAQGILERAVERMPKAKDGIDGKDGADGMGFDDLVMEHDGERRFTMRMVQGERAKSFSFELPVAIYRGVFRAGDIYEKGDMVTWAGSLWHCDEPSADKPGEPGAKGWTLTAKRGRDGKDGRDGIDKTKGVHVA